MKKLLLAIALALVFPAAGHAGLVTMTSQEIPLGPRGLLGATERQPFDMLGVHWQGPGSVAFRTRSAAGRWSAWVTADDDSGPDAGSRERQRAWRDGNLDWVGDSIAAQFRASGMVTRLRAYYLDSRVAARRPRTLASAGMPAIVPRSSWQADEAITRAKPQYAPRLELAIVHHTAGTNSYTPGQAAAIVRGIEIYHVQANGWNDIGYNFLVDRFGTIYEGRAGGVTRNVIGAHAEGFNRGTVGVALIGNFQAATPPPAMRSALVTLLAWRLDVAHVDPLSTVVYRSGGNLTYKAGRRVTLRAISGHRDTGPTACPGSGAYRLLPGIARAVARTGLPKLYAPLVTGSLGGDVRFQARLSSSLYWTVTVSAADGTIVAQHAGRSSLIDWTWDSAGAGSGPFRWSIATTVALLPASGTLGKASPPPPPPPPPGVPVQVSAPVPAGLLVTPDALAPGVDGSGGVVTVAFALASPASVTVTVRSADPGATATQTLLAAALPAGPSSFDWNLAGLPDGRYRIAVASKVAGETPVSRSVALLVDRTLTGLAAAPAAVSPNGDGAADTTTIGFQLARPAQVTVKIERLGKTVATVQSSTLGAGPQAVIWNGTAGGVPVPDGPYQAVATVTDAFGTISFSTPLTVDSTPPVLTLADATTLLLQLSEPASVTVTINGSTMVIQEPAGAFTIPWQGGPVASLTAQAQDLAGNLSAPVTLPAVLPG
jgi:N-acetylmuramoyl-L-alanine amidase